mmetsp:Transcript_48926/g.106617  ORF Transcript_48926/g.106617 Transcript_48926/m.106617 type:complete len:288 (-) Transcript_48926:27-890(-)
MQKAIHEVVGNRRASTQQCCCQASTTHVEGILQCREAQTSRTTVAAKRPGVRDEGEPQQATNAEELQQLLQKSCHEVGLDCPLSQTLCIDLGQIYCRNVHITVAHPVLPTNWKVDDKDDPNQWDKPCDGLKERGDHLQNPHRVCKLETYEDPKNDDWHNTEECQSQGWKKNIGQHAEHGEETKNEKHAQAPSHAGSSKKTNWSQGRSTGLQNSMVIGLVIGCDHFSPYWKLHQQLPATGEHFEDLMWSNSIRWTQRHRLEDPCLRLRVGRHSAELSMPHWLSMGVHG